MPRSATRRQVRAPRRPVAPLLRALLTGSLVAAIGVGSGLQATATTALSPAGTVARGVDGAVVTTEGDAPAASGRELLVAPREPVLAPDAEQFEFQVLLRNPDTNTLPAGSLTLELDTEPVTDRSSLSTEEAAAGRPAAAIATANAPQTGAEDQQSLTITVPRADIPVARQPGVYLLRAVFTPEHDPAGDGSADGAPESGSGDSAPEGRLVAVTPVVWSGAEAGKRVPLTVVVPLVLPEKILAMPSKAELGEIAPQLDTLLTAAEARQATLAIDPRLIAGIRAYGAEAPAPARALLTRLEQTSLPSFLLQFADADPAAQSALGLERLMLPTGLDFVTRDGSFPGTPESDPNGTEGEAAGTAGDTGAGSADPSGSTGGTDPTDRGTDSTEGADGTDEGAGTPDPEQPNAPSLAQLLAWPETVARGWPAAGAADAGTLALLATSGYTSVLLDSSNATAAPNSGPRVKLGRVDGLIADAELAAAARAAAAGTTEAEQRAGTARLASLLALAAGEGAPGLVLAADRGASGEAATSLATVLDGLGALPWVESTREQLQPEGAATLAAGATAADRSEALTSALSRAKAIDELSPVLEHPEYLGQYQQTRLLDLFATGYTEPDADFAAAAERFRKRDAEMLRGVSVVSTEHTQLVGTSSRIPVLIRNTLPFDARLSVMVAPSSAAIALPERRFDEQRVAAEGSATLLVPVESRVSSGDSGLIIDLRDASGEQVFFTGTMSLTLRSSVETIALVSLGSAAALLLGFGIWRSIRRRRAQAERSAA